MNYIPLSSVVRDEVSPMEDEATLLHKQESSIHIDQSRSVAVRSHSMLKMTCAPQRKSGTSYCAPGVHA